VIPILFITPANANVGNLVARSYLETFFDAHIVTF